MLKAEPGETISNFAKRVSLVTTSTECEFNGTQFIVYPDHVSQIQATWLARRENVHPGSKG